MLSVVLISLSTAAFAQSDAQHSFTALKALAGPWEGRVTTFPPMEGMGNMTNVEITLRVTSRGNALVHEMKAAGTADDPTRNDYCDAGNRPRMVARSSRDGKSVEFDFLDLSGGTQYGHMDHAVFTTVDANHHTEDWTYIMPGDKPVRAHMDLQRTDLQRTKDGSGSPSGK
jgi:hypothetical protein